MSVMQPVRRCGRCGRTLARDNRDKLCGGCSYSSRDALLKPPKLPREFWYTHQMKDALATWHMGRVIFAYRTHPWHPRPLTQEIVANWFDLTQTQLSRIENGPAPEIMSKLTRYAQILAIPGELLWFKLPDDPGAGPIAGQSSDTPTVAVVIQGQSLLLPIDMHAARLSGLDHLVDELVTDGRIAHALPTRNPDDLERIAAALNDARRYLDGSVVDYFDAQLARCKADDGRLGPANVLPLVLGILGAIQQHVSDVKPAIRRALLVVGAEGAEFAGWLYRDLRDAPSATYWYDRAMEWAQAANDTAMQGYILLKKSQMAYEERDAHRVATFAEAAQQGPWQLPGKVRVEVIQQEARGLAMLGEPVRIIEQKLEQAQRLFTRAVEDDRPQFGTYFNASALLLREASCYIEAGKPARAATLFDGALTSGGLSRRDEGYFRSRRAFACALSGEPDDAAHEGLVALSIATTTSSQRTARELARTVKALAPWSSRPGPRQLSEALRN